MDWRRVRAVAGAERRRDAHRYAATRRQRALLAVGAAALLPILAVMVRGAHSLGVAVGRGAAPALRSVLRWYLPGAFALVVFLGAIGARRRMVNFQAKPLVLTTVPSRDLVAGLLLADLANWTLSMVGPAVGLATAFGVGVGSPLAVLAGATTAALAVLAAILAGYAVGLGVRLLSYRVPVSPGRRSVLGTVTSVGAALVAGLAGAYVGSTAADLDEGMELEALVPAGDPPLLLGDVADLALVGTPLVETPSASALVAGAVVLGSIPLSVAAIARVAPRLWYADPPARPEREGGDLATVGAGDWPWRGSLTRTVAAGIVRRALRTPERFAYLGYYVIVVGVVVAGAVGNPGAAPLLVGGGVVLLGLWLAGGAVCLNPLGEEGAMVEQVALSVGPPRAFLRARLLVGVAVGLPVVWAGTGVLALGRVGLADALSLGAYWSLLAVASAGAALGIGTLLPRTEPGEVFDVVEAVVPATLGLIYHALAVALLAVGGAGLLVVDLPQSAFLGGGLAVGTVLVVLGHGGYRFAVGGLADYGRERRPDPVLAVEVGIGLAVLGTVLASTVALGSLLLFPLSGIGGFLVAFLGNYAGYAVVALAYPVLAGRGVAYLDLTVPERSDLRWIAGGLGASFLVYAGLVVATLAGLPVAGHSIAGEVADGGAAFALALVVLALLVNAPVEELLFRNGIQKRLAEAYSRRASIVLASLVFALVHLPVYLGGPPFGIAITLGSLAFQGAIWGTVYARTGTVLAPAICHGLYNGALFGLLYVSLL